MIGYCTYEGFYLICVSCDIISNKCTVSVTISLVARKGACDYIKIRLEVLLRYYNIDPPGVLEISDTNRFHNSYDLSKLIEDP